MAGYRKVGKTTTTQQVDWDLVDEISKYKQPIKRFVNQKDVHYESFNQVIRRIFDDYKKRHPLPKSVTPKSTLPY